MPAPRKTPAPLPPPAFYTTPQLAARLNQSPATVERLEGSPGFPTPVRLTPGGTKLWAVTEVDAYIATIVAAAKGVAA